MKLSLRHPTKKAIKIFLLFVISFFVWALSSSVLYSANDENQDCKTAWKTLKNTQAYSYSKPLSAELFLNGQNLNYSKYFKNLKRENCLKDWTILVYMQADNDLEAYAFWDLYEMESSFKKRLSGSTLKTDLVVQLDTHKTNKIRRLHIFQTKEKYNPNLDYRFFSNRTEEDISSPTVQFINEVNEQERPQKQDFDDFISWGMKNYPAKNYFVIIWGHGQGWAFDSSVQFGGIAFDHTQNSKLVIPDIVASLKDKPVQLLASDACLMQTLEVATELSSVSDFVIGSTQIHNYLGLPYRRLLYEINSGHFLGLKRKVQSDDEAYVMARMIPKLFKQSFDPIHGQQGRIDNKGIESLTMSSINSWQLRNVLIPEIDKLGKLLLKFSETNAFESRLLKMKIENMPKFLGGSRDLGTLLGHIKEFFSRNNKAFDKSQLSKQINKVFEALSLTIMEYSFGTNYQSFYRLSRYYIAYFKAFGIWMPTSNGNYQTYKDQYKNTSLYGKYLSHSWMKWIESLYNINSMQDFPFPSSNPVAGSKI